MAVFFEHPVLYFLLKVVVIVITRVQVGLRKSDPIARLKKRSRFAKCVVHGRASCTTTSSQPLELFTTLGLRSNFEDPKRPVVHV